MRGFALGVLLFLAVPAFANGNTSQHHACRQPRGTKLLASNAQLRAWLRTAKAQGYPGTFRSIVTVCAPPDGREHQLLNETASVTGVRFDGAVIGFAAKISNQYTEAQALHVGEADGRQLLGTSVENWPLGRQQPTPGFDGYAIDATGDVAWVETNANGTAGTGETLFAKAAAGPKHTLATGEKISQLAFAKGALSWADDGSSASAPFG